METELQSLQASRSFKKSSSNISIGSDDSDVLVKYTSLKDILSSIDSPANRSSFSVYPSFDGLNSSSILIKNHLVKHAASAYLQSTAMLATRDQNWFARMCRQSQRQREVIGCGCGCGCGWEEYVCHPFRVCVGVVVRSARAMIASITRQVVRVWP